MSTAPDSSFATEPLLKLDQEVDQDTSTSTTRSFERSSLSSAAHAHLQGISSTSHGGPKVPESITDIRLFDGQNSPQNIAVYGFGLGALFGGSIVLATIVKTSIPQFWLFLAALGVFHALEYIAIALFNPMKLKLDSFLLNHSPEYTIATASGITEFLIELYFFPQLKSWSWINKIGLVMVIVGQIARTLAMFSAKSNFSHHVEYYKEEHHVLVTGGIYSVLRHPSYFGFYYWALGSQLMMMNPVCLIGFAGALHHFFSDRIVYEEKLLVRFFGQDYRDYQARTRTGLPLIK
ncbi:protein-S-isoprenylcysteine O-methyltransferase [Entomortierella parvispora]|uniref:Protein-S-isoprenylcysteine O-methyltransferase n=1 Tax=Entomortierella parvispora TaxID=205924 RepID=A0A9P3H9C9_9FUNG|nr:protein-S-isoprenylcysteine O-methyltransferase [Entomortierella parvispora]